jgi:hypothetical protein
MVRLYALVHVLEAMNHVSQDRLLPIITQCRGEAGKVFGFGGCQSQSAGMPSGELVVA